MKRICKKVRKNLPAFINNQLDKEKVKTIEQHFNICPICRKEAEDIRLTWNLLAEHTIEKDFPDLTNSILEYIERRQKSIAFSKYYRKVYPASGTSPLSSHFSSGHTAWSLFGQKSLPYTK